MLSENPIAWIDPRTWPWFVYVWLAFMVAGWIKPAWRRVQRNRARSWSTAEGRIETADVSQPKQLGIFTSPKGHSSQLAEIKYSYSVAGNFYAGQYKREFATEDEAWNFLRDLKGKPVSVRYNPNKPSTSALSESAVETLIQARPPAPESEEGSGDDIPDWLRPLIWPFVFLSAVGLVASLYVHLAAVMGQNFSAEFWVLHVGIFVVWFPAVFVAQKRVGNVNRKDFWKVVLKGAPEWMRYMVYAFMGYAMVNFAFFAMKTQNGAHGGDATASEWRGFSGHWMVFYSAALAILYAAASSTSRWRCINGHSVPKSSNYCQRCGQPVVRASRSS